MNWYLIVALVMVSYDALLHALMIVKPKFWWVKRGLTFWPEFFYFAPGRYSDEEHAKRYRHFDAFWAMYHGIVALLIFLGLS